MSPSERPPSEERVFAEPWEAQVFALAVSLHERGHFTWAEWTARLARAGGAPSYADWLAALEALVVEKGIADAGSLAVARDAWDHAARHTPHGQPITLGSGRRHHGPLG